MVEPFVIIEREYALHSWLTKDGICKTGAPTQLITDESGAWVTSKPAHDLAASEQESLEHAHLLVADRLQEVGYFGPFSTDAFRYVNEVGRICFHPMSELNARYSMGFFVGFANMQDEWAALVRA
jgi:hypothetical protein